MLWIRSGKEILWSRRSFEKTEWPRRTDKSRMLKSQVIKKKPRQCAAFRM